MFLHVEGHGSAVKIAQGHLRALSALRITPPTVVLKKIPFTPYIEVACYPSSQPIVAKIFSATPPDDALLIFGPGGLDLGRRCPPTQGDGAANSDRGRAAGRVSRK
jgi:hypothetical protein